MGLADAVAIVCIKVNRVKKRMCVCCAGRPSPAVGVKVSLGCLSGREDGWVDGFVDCRSGKQEAMRAVKASRVESQRTAADSIRPSSRKGT